MSLEVLLKNIDGIELEINKDLTKFSTMRLKCFGDLITIKTLEGLKGVLKILNENSVDYRILGMGANQLLPESSAVPFIKLSLEFDKSYLNEVRDLYTLPASVTLSILSSHAVRNGLKGWESFTGIPATLGGAVFMNAGTNLGEIGPLIKRVFVVNKQGEEKIYEMDESSFSYRKQNFLAEGDFIYQVEMNHFGVDPLISKQIKDYLELRNRTQPLREWTCGCVFKNSKEKRTCLAGKFIDIMGLKGLTLNGMRISPKHANFMENTDSCSHKDVVALINIIKEELLLQYGVDFETEVKL
ncbi:UDP-N-acetylenolpyruvoylglucosamine reductase [Halobacteriovorax marinus]|uniref:UDP-N-acetylmuramate dehydrogenase n=1 Tax=Halobacteriovorax marinus TaxID=97084 RepID=UPI000BC3253B|nr:UDP-N-acetylmuramate dehydrogenase [Halobacteriovorax marinus]ATH06443.1 UDP-N-acetylenolpyruvoylglucosamine reductase [Halobacteriovorax marinus]